MKRVGIAFTPPSGPTARRSEYEILEGEFGTRYLRYVGYREQRPNGEAMVGLPLAGPNASWAQPIIDFRPFGLDVRLFKETH